MASLQPLVRGTLKNVGNSCYLNTTIQMLYSIDTLRYCLKFVNFDTITKSPLLSKIQKIDFEKDKTVLKHLKTIFERLEQGIPNINLIDLNTQK